MPNSMNAQQRLEAQARLLKRMAAVEKGKAEYAALTTDAQKAHYIAHVNTEFGKTLPIAEQWRLTMGNVPYVGGDIPE